MAATSADDLFKCISLNKNFWILNKIPLNYATYGLIGSIGSALVQIMARRRIGDKPISEALSVCCTDAYMRHWASMSYIIYNIHCSKTFKHAHLLHVFIVHLLIFTLNIVLNQTNTAWEDNHRLSLGWSQGEINMMTSSNGNIFRVTGPLYGEFTGHRWIPITQKPATHSLNVVFFLRLNKRLNKQSRGWWLGTPSSPLWRHCNDLRQWHESTMLVTLPSTEQYIYSQL